MEIAMLMKPLSQNSKKSTKVTKTQDGDMRGGQIKTKSKFLAKKVAPLRGELKSKKASKVAETQGGDMHGGQIKTKSEHPVNKVAPSFIKQQCEAIAQ